MDGKISFGVDFLHTMLETDKRSDVGSPKAHPIAMIMLIMEWGLSLDEVNEANKLFWKKNDDKTLDDFPQAVNRLILYTKDVPDAKSKLVTDMIAISYLDGNVSEDEKKLILALGEMYDFRPSEMAKFSNRAFDILNVLTWVANNDAFKEDQSSNS